MAISIDDEQFILDCCGLALGSYEMVLGVQWSESLGPMLWDFSRRMLTFMHDGHQVCWRALNPALSTSTLLATSNDVMEDLLLQFSALFAMPTSILPLCSCNHQIRLMPGTESVVVRPCCCA
jgi:hypothetical protein